MKYILCMLLLAACGDKEGTEGAAEQTAEETEASKKAKNLQSSSNIEDMDAFLSEYKDLERTLKSYESW